MYKYGPKRYDEYEKNGRLILEVLSQKFITKKPSIVYDDQCIKINFADLYKHNECKGIEWIKAQKFCDELVQDESKCEDLTETCIKIVVNVDGYLQEYNLSPEMLKIRGWCKESN